MKALLTIVVGLLVTKHCRSAMDPQGVKCGQKRCTIVEYCSPYDTHCRPCSEACDVQSRNYQPRECASDCQDYLHDQRYVLRSELGLYDDLEGEVQRLRVLMTVSITITCLSLLAIAYLLGKALVRWDKLGAVFRRAFAKKWTKKNCGVVGPRDDPEATIPTKQNGLKLTMPTISASVASSRCTGNRGGCGGNAGRDGNGTANGNGNGNGKRNDNDNDNDNGTPNTTSTPLSRRHPSEDTTLDYAYDNPAMTPSPEAAQLRTKRESSF